MAMRVLHWRLWGFSGPSSKTYSREHGEHSEYREDMEYGEHRKNQ